jgi:hypothetical protein
MKSLSLFAAALAVGYVAAAPADLLLQKRQGGIGAMVNSVVNRKFLLAGRNNFG